MPLLARVFLRDLQLDCFAGLLHCAKQWGRWLPHLKINGSILDLQNDVVLELSIQRMKVVVCGFRTVRLGITPVEMMVVNKRPVHHHAVMRLQRARDHVGSIGSIAPVLRRSRSSLRICLDDKAGEIRDLLVNSINSLLPPCSYLWVQRIERAHPPGTNGAAQIDRNRELHSPMPK